MRGAFALLLAVVVVTSGCRTHESFICGTALFENMFAEQQAQASPLVFCPLQEADLILTVSVTVTGAHPRHSAAFYFRQKRPEERVALRENVARLVPTGSAHPHSLDRASVFIRGEDLWVHTEVYWGNPDRTSTGSLSLGRPVAFSRDLQVVEAGSTLECSWKKVGANKPPAPVASR